MKKILSIIMLLACFCTMAQAQVKAGDVIQGTVSDDIEPLMMVNVVEVDKTGRIVAHGVTDINGNFSFRIQDPKNHLEVSYIGYQKQSLPINKKTYKIVLKSNTTIKTVTIEAVKKTYTAGLSIPVTEISTAQQTIDMKEFEGLAMTSVEEALQGRIAGLDIVMSGNLGSGSQMRLRGVSTLQKGNAEPLIVVDGNIRDGLKTAEFDLNDDTNEHFAELLQVNPEDIESITVLKDAGSTAIWGSRGANGVIEIKTKRGQRGKTRVSYRYSIQGTWQPRGMPVLNGDDYTMFLKESYFNPTLNSAIADNTSSEYIPEINYDPNYSQYHMFNNNTDWEDHVKQFGQNHSHYVTLSGGGAKARFRVGGGYDHQIGSTIKQKYDRFTTRVALDYAISQRINVATNFSLSYSANHRNAAGDLLGIAYKKMPNVAVYEEDEFERSTGDYYIMNKKFTSSQLNDQLGIENPVASANMSVANEYSLSLSPEFILRYDLLSVEPQKHRLQYQGSINFNIQSAESKSFKPTAMQNNGWDDSSSNAANTNQSKSNSMNTRHNLTFTPWLGTADHSIMAMFQFEYGQNQSTSQGLGRYMLPTGDITSSLAGGVIASFSGNGVNRGKNNSMAFQTHYAYKGKYILDFTARYDRSNGNPKNWGKYYGISGRWNITDEKFMKGIKWLNMLSIAPGWGRSGRPNGGATSMYNTYSSDGDYMGISAMRPTQIRLSVIRPANQDSWNIGSNWAILENKISGDVQVYMSQSEQVQGFNIPTSAGYNQIPSKLQARVRNIGWEFNINGRELLKTQILGKKFNCDFNVSFANNRNEILEMNPMTLEQMQKEFNHDNGQYLSRVQLHNPVGSIYGFRYKGVYAYSEWSEEEIKGVSGPNAPVARNAAGEAILNENGRTKPMMFDYGTTNYEFKGGDAIYEDINHDGNINELDIVYLGSSLPKLIGGFGLRMRWDQVTLNFQFNYRLGQNVLNTARMNAEKMYNNENQSKAVNWRWHNEGDVALIPRALHDYGYNWLGSDRFMEEASFLRLNYITCGYSFKSKVLKPYGMKSLSLNLNVNNVFVITKYSGADPEHGQSGYDPASDGGRTPRQKSFTFAINVGF